MLGSADGAKLKLKAAETKTMLYAVVDMVARYVDRMSRGAETRDAGLALVRYMDVIKIHGRRVPLAAVQDRQHGEGGGSEEARAPTEHAQAP
jgi:hypothetical protein